MKLDNPEFEIRVLDTCPLCKGHGSYQDALWEQFDVENGDFMHWHERIDTAHAWFSDHGIPELPDEEVDCGRCGGTGKIRRKVDMDEVMDYLFEKDDHITGLLAEVVTLRQRVERLEETK